MKRVLFVCVHNSGRSQMAEAFANRLGEGVMTAESAGTQPAVELNPTVVQAMEEIGYDMSAHDPKLMTEEMVHAADRVITMGCGVNLEEMAEGATCPAMFVPSEDWGIEDPKGKPVEVVREIREKIRTQVEGLVKEMRDAGQ